ncbi:MAG: hypothetical protein KJ593_03860 [Candidatus Omnitrophica bacterium]|nr:hypothetical protein [Candidatus Omnitrophota bacterium]
MSDSVNIFRVGLIIIVILLLILVSAAGFFLQQEIKKNTNLGEQLIKAQEQENLLKSSFENSDEKISRLNILIGESQEEIKSLTSKISVLENDNMRLSEELSSLKGHMHTTNNQNIEFLKKVDDLENELRRKEGELGIAVKEKEDLLAKLEVLEQKRSSIDLEKIVVKPLLEGKIVNIDRKYKFLIIDRGEQNNVEVGDIFICFLDDREIGQVKVEKVYESLSAANFLPDLQFQYLKQGAKVVRR